MGPFAQNFRRRPEIVMADRPAASAAVSVMKPQSRGSLRIASADPAMSPKITLAFLDAERDCQALIKGIRRLRAIFARAPMETYHATEFFPGAGAQSDDELLGAARMISGSLQHMVGTCRMGTAPSAPLDEKLRVRGVANLRVADASIMPDITSGNTNGPTMAIGQRAAELILSD
jgi:choline dehydrogenase